MSDKMTCPGCNSYTSSVLAAFSEGAPCPHCGLSHEAISEICAVQRSRSGEDLKEKLAEAIRRREDAEVKAARLERQIERIRRALDAQEHP